MSDDPSRRAVLQASMLAGVGGAKVSPAEVAAPAKTVGLLDNLTPGDIRPDSDVYLTSGVHEVGLGAARYVRSDYKGESDKVYRRRVGPHLLTLNEPVKRIEFFGASRMSGAEAGLDCTRAFLDALEYAAERGKDGLTLELGEGRHHVETTLTVSKAARFRLQGIGGRIANLHRKSNQISGSEIVNGSGGVLFDFVDDVQESADPHTCGVEINSIGISQLSDRDIALRFQTQWAQPRIRSCAFIGGKHAYTFAGNSQPFDVECEDVWFYNQDVACFMPDTGQSDYLHMVWRNCVWRYCGTAVETEVANSVHVQGGLVEANGAGLKLAGVVGLIELGQGLHFEQQKGLDVHVSAGERSSSAVSKILRIEGVTATWNKNGDQKIQVQIDDALSTVVQGNGFYGGGAALPGDRWVSLALNQPPDRVVLLGPNALDGDLTIANKDLLVTRTGDRRSGGRMLIGGAEDDGSSMLNVKGTVRADRIEIGAGFLVDVEHWVGSGPHRVDIGAQRIKNSGLCVVIASTKLGGSTVGAVYGISFHLLGGRNYVQATPLGGMGSEAFIFKIDRERSLTVTPRNSGRHRLTFLWG